MNYKNGRDVLPPSLLRELQKYLDGELLYVPKSNERRARWGEVSGTRRLLAERNKEICRMHADGSSIEELELKYHLSSESIRKIIVKSRARPVMGGSTDAEAKQASGIYSSSTVR
ncbi:CD3324 family protein [Paenibacillaceae bacterium WGS1546]|uniref:CD3324 family protein n=1 Tax=Cohnella sp. WGS1546 TaxID=3366810 RepID=UPI00372D4E85